MLLNYFLKQDTVGSALTAKKRRYELEERGGLRFFTVVWAVVSQEIQYTVYIPDQFFFVLWFRSGGDAASRRFFQLVLSLGEGGVCSALAA